MLEMVLNLYIEEYFMQCIKVATTGRNNLENQQGFGVGVVVVVGVVVAVFVVVVVVVGADDAAVDVVVFFVVVAAVAVAVVVVIVVAVERSPDCARTSLQNVCCSEVRAHLSATLA